jgi:phosphatidylglycerol:prolipoprotein diacylglycerol transferase
VTPLVLTYPDLNPIALKLGPLVIHWYGVMYGLAFLIGYALLRRRVKSEPYSGEPAWTKDDVANLIFYAVGGVLLGGRLGYVLIYKPTYYFTHPLDIVMIWDGGMSFHGGAIGVIVAIWLFIRREHRPFLQVSDLLVPAVPVGLGLGRIGNFINGELWGRPADPSLPWAMIFPQVDNTPRHPSQLYEFLLEGVLLFVLLALYDRRRPAAGCVSGAFLVGYGIFRFIAEHFREPDSYLGVLGLGLSMGQWLCVPMILAGIALWWWSWRRGRKVRDLPQPAEEVASSPEPPAA